jgi:Zinc knuckle
LRSAQGSDAGDCDCLSNTARCRQDSRTGSTSNSKILQHPYLMRYSIPSSAGPPVTMALSESSFNLKVQPGSHTGTSDLTYSTFATSAVNSFNTPDTSAISKLCHNCDSAAHQVRHCNQPKKCFNCGEVGHMMKDCRIKAQRSHSKLARHGGWGTRSRKEKYTTQPCEGNIQSIFEEGYQELYETSTSVKVTPDLIDLSSDEEYKPHHGIAPKAASNKQLYSNVIQGRRFTLPDENQPVELAEPTLFDQVTDEQKTEEMVSVTLHRKRKGRNGRGSTYDLTPFLAY